MQKDVAAIIRILQTRRNRVIKDIMQKTEKWDIELSEAEQALLEGAVIRPSVVAERRLMMKPVLKRRQVRKSRLMQQPLRMKAHLFSLTLVLSR